MCSLNYILWCRKIGSSYEKTQLTKITTILPFDAKYIKVGKNRNKLWNLMDSEGNLISDVWFENIEKNNDGSIKTINEKKEEIKFTSVKSIGIFNEVIKFVPATVMNIVDVDSIERYENDGYVARSYFFGKRVYIKADGRIFDENGNELRIMFNSVDTIRLNKALLALNKKLHYDGNFCSGEHGWSHIIKNKVSIFGFYWIDDDNCCVYIGRENVDMDYATKKWTDEFKIRATLNMPKSIREQLTEKWGEPKISKKDEYNENYTWSFTKDKLEFIIDTLNEII